MESFYHKPLGQVAVESQGLLAANAQMLTRQQSLAAGLAQAPARAACAVCDADLRGLAPALAHRGVDYLLCPDCGHLQSRPAPPAGYPQAQDRALGFEQVYPQLTPAEFASRRDRVYRPKLEWCLGALERAGIGRGQARGLSWLELGCGAGYFLGALAQEGMAHIRGLESNPTLVANANQALGRPLALPHGQPLEEAPRQFQAQAWAAFFVLEHLERVGDFFRAFASQPSGTLLVFSVPCFGLATVLEDLGCRQAARNLDNALHTQLFSEQSIARCLELGGLRGLGQWVFGQDAADLFRLAMVELDQAYAPALRQSVAGKLEAMLDELQQVVDRHHFADARHVLAVRE